MAKKNAKKKPKQRDSQDPRALPPEEQTSASFYKLKVQAVDDLVNADAGNSPPVSPEELRKYQSGPHLNVPSRIKAVLVAFLLKAWLAGTVCYFLVFGTGIRHWLDVALICGALMGILTDLISNPLYRLYAQHRALGDRWLMVPEKKFVSFPVNTLYGIVLSSLTVAGYIGINSLHAALTAAPEPLLNVEPLFFGILTGLWDLAAVSVKHLIQRIIGDAKRKVEEGAREERHV